MMKKEGELQVGSYGGEEREGSRALGLKSGSSRRLGGGGAKKVQRQ